MDKNRHDSVKKEKHKQGKKSFAKQALCLMSMETVLIFCKIYLWKRCKNFFSIYSSLCTSTFSLSTLLMAKVRSHIWSLPHVKVKACCCSNWRESREFQANFHFNLFMCKVAPYVSVLICILHRIIKLKYITLNFNDSLNLITSSPKTQLILPLPEGLTIRLLRCQKTNHRSCTRHRQYPPC